VGLLAPVAKLARAPLERVGARTPGLRAPTRSSLRLSRSRGPPRMWYTRGMSQPRPFLDVPFGAYLARDVPPPDDELTRVGPRTPCGEYLRRFWQPVAFARDLGAVPLRIRIMGEDLVVFRDGAGRVGLLQLHCTHRGTSLEFGMIAERGIRCCYHGWRFDVDGRILETPGEPASSTLKLRLCQGAYPTREFAGLIFAYMGPPDRMPAFPIYDTFDLPGLVLAPARKLMLPCNS